MTGLPTGFLEMATIHGPYLTHDMGPSIKDGTLLHNRERTAEASGRNRTVTFHGLLRQETEEEGLPHLMSRQLPTKPCAHKFGQNIYRAQTQAVKCPMAWGCFGLSINIQALGDAVTPSPLLLHPDQMDK